MITHKCEYCGIEKQYKSPSLVKRFCSYKCSSQWKWEHVREAAQKITLTCPECKKQFQIPQSKYKVRMKHPHDIFCSRECWRKNIGAESKECPNCKKTFTPRDRRHNFCSKKCYQEYAKATGCRKRTGFWMENGYRVIQIDGKPIKEHRHIAEIKLGRKLKPTEIVHHIDGNKINNDPNNLEIMTIAEHSSMHRNKEIKQGKTLFGRKTYS